MEKEKKKDLEKLCKVLSGYSVELISKENIHSCGDDSPPGHSEEIAIYDFPGPSDGFNSEVRFQIFPDCDKMLFTLRIKRIDSAEIDGLFYGTPPSELKENYLAESDEIEKIYDFWQGSLSALKLGFKEVGLKNYIEVAIEEKKMANKFVLRIEFSIPVKNFDAVIGVLSKLHNMWKAKQKA